MSRARSILLAGLLVLSAVVTGVGPALAQSTTDTYAQEFTTGPHKVEIDLSNVTTETTISVITSGSPAGDNVTIMKKSVSASTSSAHFRNAGAYETFTVQVEGADAEPGFSKGGVTAAWTPGDSGKFLGDTGGDADFNYELNEQIGESVMPQVVQLDRTGLPGSTKVDTSETDAAQTKVDIYQSAQNSNAASEGFHTTLDNYLSDTKTQARIIGKNAYIKALNSGASKSAAKTEAKQAVADYYATKQVNLMNQYEVEAQNYDYLHSVAANESNIASTLDGNQDTFVGTSHTHPYGDGGTIEYQGLNSVSYTLTNGSSHTYQAPKVFVDAGYDSGDNINPTLTAHTAPSSVESSAGSGRSSVHLESLMIRAPNDNYQNLKIVRWQEFNRLNSDIQSQNSEVQADMDTLAENTYSAYQAGEINNSDLVDPYVLSNQQSAGEDFQGWAAAQLTLLGTNSPENFDQIGSFNVTTESGTQYEGVLFSQENPASGQFENGTTYNTSNIGGTQYVVTSDRIVELDGEFTIDSISTQDGQTVQNVTIQKTTYETTNVTELKQQYEDLARKRAEIEAREQNLRGSAGGGLLGGSSSSLVLVLIGVGALYAVSQRRTGGNN
ncbi:MULTISPECIES: hypothetical protein [unclassified Haloarcula]|uniref:hypothetical protein n=1 Tax=unclassified Haloarcula TaxID=2624677 RepID=UPI0007BB841C|nr:MULTISPECIES: hypothetical protein [unclassified Haloarcula]KZX46796.1 hypothetical protein AV929_00255 [Haloarcula sp. K1]MUV49102.1 hypothetical protein [Haloarcula sp. CBA1122]